MRGVPGDTRHGGREGGLQWKVPCLKIHTTARNGSDALHCPPPFMGPSRLLVILGEKTPSQYEIWREHATLWALSPASIYPNHLYYR
jgi:hypothetical protein